MGMLASLPTTAYIKMIDIWMIFSMLYPFFIVFLHSTMEVVKNISSSTKIETSDWTRSSEERGKKIKNCFRFLLNYGLPSMVIFFIIIFWTFGLINKDSKNIDSLC